MAATNEKAGFCPLFPAPRKCLLLRYQGTTFLSPFFFLLLDSFLESFLSSVLCEASVLLASAPCASPLVAESAFAGCSLPVPLVASVDGLVVGDAAAASGVDPAGPGAEGVPSAGVALSVAGGATPPGVTVSTTAVFLAPPDPAPPSCDLPPPLNMSVAEVVSASGSSVGAPDFADATISPCGAVRTSASGFFTSPSRLRGVFCSAVIHATALGSGR